MIHKIHWKETRVFRIGMPTQIFMRNETHGVAEINLGDVVVAVDITDAVHPQWPMIVRHYSV